MQLFDAGIIDWVKEKNKRRLFLCVFDNIDKGRNSIYKVEVLCEMRWTEEEWNDYPTNVIETVLSTA